MLRKNNIEKLKSPDFLADIANVLFFFLLFFPNLL